MASSYTTNLGFVVPTTGELSGTWGTVLSTGFTQLADSAIAGTTTLSADADVTLTTTDGAANQARSAVILWTASNGATPRNVTAPARTKAYIVVNTGTGSVVIRGVGPTTGVTVTSGTRALVAWNGSDFVAVATSVTGASLSGTNTWTGAQTFTNSLMKLLGSSTGLTVFASANSSGTDYTITFPASTGTVLTTAAAVTPAQGGTGVANNAAMTVTGSGNYAYTRTLTGATNVTFPTSGTLAILGANTFTGTQEMPAVKITTGAAAGKYLKSDSVGGATWADVASGGITAVTTATTATTLTSTPTLLKITPASYGVTVTLPDATTCSLGGPLHIIDNRGAYPVRVCDSSGTLKGFIFAGVVSHISLDDKSTAAGVWAIANSELVGASAQLLTTTVSTVAACIDLGTGRELIIGSNGSVAPYYTYGVVYDRVSNVFGSATALRSVNTTNRAAVLSGANQVLYCSCAAASTAFEAVVLSISGTTITVNTAATATLSANIDAFADGCGLIAVGTRFVTNYVVAGTLNQLRAITVSGTTVTIGSAVSPTGNKGGLIIAGGGDVAIYVGCATTHLYTEPYTVSDTALTAGTGTDTNSGTMTLNKLAPTGGGRWWVLYNNGGASGSAGVISLSATTTTINTCVALGVGAITEAMVVGTTKLLVQEATGLNIITDSAGTPTAGTYINPVASANFLFSVGTDVYVQAGTTTYSVVRIDCSGASPVKAEILAQTNLSNVEMPAFGVSNSMLSRNPVAVYGSAYARTVTKTAATVNFASCLRSGSWNKALPAALNEAANTSYRGKAANEVWLTDAATVITKVECVA